MAEVEITEGREGGMNEHQASKLHSKQRIEYYKEQLNHIKTDRIFNRIFNNLCAAKGLKFMTDAEYTEFERKSKADIKEELEL
jgi:hypothetical protein